MRCVQVRSDEDSNQTAMREAESGEDHVSDVAAMAAEAQGVLDMDAPTASDDPWSSPVLQEV